VAGSPKKKIEKGAAAHGREALSEWGKAARYGARAIAGLISSRYGGGEGPSLVERLRPGDDAEFAAAPMPIQESIDVAIPVSAAFALCKRFDEYPEFLDRVQEVEEVDASHVTFLAKVHGRAQELEVEILDERPDQRFDWECANGVEHSGVVSFHPLAPRLTRLELTVDLEPGGPLERLARRVHLTEHAIRDELHRFKAYADLWEEEAEYDDAEALEESDEIEDEEPEDEDGDELEEEDLEPEEELEPTASGR
jgi:uncharacterized membrane protein